MIFIFALALAGCGSAEKAAPKNACEERREDLKFIYKNFAPTFGPMPIILCPGDEIKL